MNYRKDRKKNNRVNRNNNGSNSYFLQVPPNTVTRQNKHFINLKLTKVRARVV